MKNNVGGRGYLVRATCVIQGVPSRRIRACIACQCPTEKLTERTPWAELVAADDLALTGEWTRGNHDAFAVIVDRYQRLVFSVAVRIVKDASEAEEVVQTVFLDIFRDLGKFDPARDTEGVALAICLQP